MESRAARDRHTQPRCKNCGGRVDPIASIRLIESEGKRRARDMARCTWCWRWTANREMAHSHGYCRSCFEAMTPNQRWLAMEGRSPHVPAAILESRPVRYEDPRPTAPKPDDAYCLCAVGADLKNGAMCPGCGKVVG